MAGDQRLVGVWHRRHAAGARRGGDVYPAVLRIDGNGLYSGQTEPAGEFTLWDAGTWRVHRKGQVALSTANDAVVTYAYAFEGKRYDAGTTMGWLKASVELALQRPDLGSEFRTYLAGLEL